jgi:hypothetical protein
MEAEFVANRYKRAYMAQILGPDEKYVFKRKFLGRKEWVSKCYYKVDATSDLEALPDGSVVEVVLPSHRHDYRDYFVKRDGEWIKIAEGEGRPDDDTVKKILEALERGS